MDDTKLEFEAKDVEVEVTVLPVRSSLLLLHTYLHLQEHIFHHSVRLNRFQYSAAPRNITEEKVWMEKTAE